MHLACSLGLTCLHLSTRTCCCCVCIGESCPGDRVWGAFVRITALAHVESNIKRGALPCGSKSLSVRESVQQTLVREIFPHRLRYLSVPRSSLASCVASSRETAGLPKCRAWLLGWTRRRLLAQLESREEPLEWTHNTILAPYTEAVCHSAMKPMSTGWWATADDSADSASQ